jgi:transcriptional pleiotropic regulator of transition state genes
MRSITVDNGGREVYAGNGATLTRNGGPMNGGKVSTARATGVSRKVDDLGRIVLPAELRRSFDIREGDHIDIAVEEDRIVLSKRRSVCTFCGSAESLRQYRSHQLCAPCLSELKRF